MKKKELEKLAQDTLYKEQMKGYMLGAKTVSNIVLEMIEGKKTKEQIALVMKSISSGEVQKVVQKNLEKK